MTVLELKGEQLRAARALLRWPQQMLAEKASQISPVSPQTIKRWEAVDGPINATTASVSAVLRVLMEHGVELLNDGAPGARLRRNK